MIRLHGKRGFVTYDNFRDLLMDVHDDMLARGEL